VLVELIGATLLLAAGGCAIGAMLAGETLLERVLAVVLGALSELTGCLIAAGVSHVLRPAPVALLYASVTIALVVVARPRRAAAWTGRLARDLGAAAREAPRALRRWWLAILAVLVVVEASWRAMLAFLLPMTGSDALNYHLPTVAWWLQKHGFTSNPFTPESRGYPSGTELVFTHVALFERDVSFVDLTQLGFAFLGCLAVAGLARLFGSSRATAAAAGMVFFLTPVVLAQANVAYVDVASAAELAVCLLFVGRMVREGWPLRTRGALKAAALAGLAGGLCLGSKPVAPVWIAAVVVVLIVNLAVVGRRGRRIARAAWPGLAVFVVLAAAFGGYWYLRNASRFSNPLYPATVSIDETTIFQGVGKAGSLIDAAPGQPLPFPLSVVKSWAHGLAPFLTGERFYRYDQRSGGFGPVWVYAVLPLSLFGLIRLRSRRDRATLTVVVAAVLGWMIAPYTWWSRFGLVLVGVGVAFAAVQLEQVESDRIRKALLALGVVTVLVGVGMSTWQYQLGDGRSVTTVQALRLLGKGEQARLMNVGGAGLAARVPNGSTIAVDPSTTTYFMPIWGDRFQHELVPVDLSSRDALTALRREPSAYIFSTTNLALDRFVRPAVRQIAADGKYRLYRLSS
jgi:hypothetical protein